MIHHHLVRIGQFGHVGRFHAADGAVHDRGTRVVCRTRRGLEAGEVLSVEKTNLEEADGTLLRPMSDEDELLQARLEKDRHSACDECVQILADRNLPATLLDVEVLFDGRSLYFYFLGDVPREVEQLTEELASAYDAEARLSQFATSLTEGCGPDCGTEAADSHCGTSCGSCAVLGACSSKTE